MTLPHFLNSDKSYQPTPAITPPFNETLESMQLRYPPFSHMVCMFLVECSRVKMIPEAAYLLPSHNFGILVYQKIRR